MNIKLSLIGTINVRYQLLTNTSMVWYKSKETNACFDIINSTKIQALLNEFSYADSENASFDNCEFNTKQTIELSGEHYGGKGIGTNGGGVRCGNIGEYQIKGVGTNLLVGKNTPQDHAYGGLDLEGAIVETIYTNAINKALPVGAVDVVGLIYTGGNSGFTSRDKSKPVPGALLVRKTCIRPAHFIQAHNFQPTDEYKQKYYSDVHRTKAVNQALKAYFQDNVNYIKYLGQFLANCANQFAFARVLGISHGTISPSNISFDGKWLDVPLATFVGGGLNCDNQIPLFQEPFMVLEIIDELTYTYSKYNKTGLNVQPLISYYQSQLDAYFSHYLAIYFGLPLTIDKTEFNNEWQALVEFVGVFIKQKTVTYHSTYARQQQAPMHKLVLLLFKSLHQRNVASIELAAAFQLKPEKVKVAVDTFNAVFAAIHKQQTEGFNFNAFVTGCFIKAIKRSGFIRFFNKENGIAKSAMQLANAVELEKINDLILTCDEVAEWIFDYSDSNTTVVFNSKRLKIIHDQSNNLFEIMLNQSEVIKLNLFEFHLWLSDLDDELLTLNSYCFKQDLLDIQLASEYENTMELACG